VRGPIRYSTIYTAFCEHLGQEVVVKVYDKPKLSAKKQKMATREAIVLKFLNSTG